MRLRHLTIACVVLVAAGVACQTTRTEPPETPDLVPGPPTGYQPASYVAPIQWADGQYRDLFHSDSYAVWVDDNVAALKREGEEESGAAPPERMVGDAVAISDDFIVFECHIESVFRDTSMAYDVVGFRGIEVHLETPDGTQMNPIQTIIGTPVEEEQRGALKLFRRTNILVFPRENLWTGASTVAQGSGSVRLVLTGHGSTYYFEWPEAPVPSADDGWRWKPSENETVQMLKVSFTDLYGRLRRLAHTFD